MAKRFLDVDISSNFEMTTHFMRKKWPMKMSKNKCQNAMLLLLLLSAVTHAPFMRQCWGLQVGPMHETAVMGKLINAALLSLMRRVWVYAVLPSSWVNSSAPLVCRRDRVTWEVGRVGLVGRDRGTFATCYHTKFCRSKVRLFCCRYGGPKYLWDAGAPPL